MPDEIPEITRWWQEECWVAVGSATDIFCVCQLQVAQGEEAKDKVTSKISPTWRISTWTITATREVKRRYVRRLLVNLSLLLHVTFKFTCWRRFSRTNNLIMSANSFDTCIFFSANRVGLSFLHIHQQAFSSGVWNLCDSQTRHAGTPKPASASRVCSMSDCCRWLSPVCHRSEEGGRIEGSALWAAADRPSPAHPHTLTHTHTEKRRVRMLNLSCTCWPVTHTKTVKCTESLLTAGQLLEMFEAL